MLLSLWTQAKNFISTNLVVPSNWKISKKILIFVYIEVHIIRLTDFIYQIHRYKNNIVVFAFTGAMIRPPVNNMSNGRSFSDELILMSQQRLNCQPAPTRVTSDINTDWRHMVASQQRHPQQQQPQQQQPAFRTNFMQSQGTISVKFPFESIIM